MGKLIEKTALQQGHEIAVIIDNEDDWLLKNLELREADVAIEFSTPDSALENILRCFRESIPVISGTTGWLNKLDGVLDLIEKQNHGMVYASNFSVGVNVLFEMNRKLAGMMNPHSEYKVSLEEIHHIHKLDAPSGTAKTIADDIVKEMELLKEWKLTAEDVDKDILPVNARREGEVVGTHIITYESPIDTISLKHEAHNREGFAKGAVMAAQWIIGKSGFYSMRDVLFGDSQ